MRVLFYGNGSSGNHGCEAIVRGTIRLLASGTNSFRIQSENVKEDKSYGLETLAQVCPAKSERKRDIRFLSAYVKMKLTGNYTDMDGLYYLPGILEASAGADVALSVGGDNYCYGGTGIYAYLNRAYKKRGVKTALWGCSIEPEVVTQRGIAEDLARYDLIVARESITCEAVRRVQENVVLAPDPAFFMEPRECGLDSCLCAGNIIGVNISPMIISNEKSSGMAYENYKRLIQYILSETDAVIALIPHVVWASNDDRRVLRQLYEDFGQNPRLVLIEDHTAPELKYIISKCSFFVGARTHATIAAYSSCVPTLVVGYSVKARGIARDLFGTEDGYVLPVQDMCRPQQLTEAFNTLYENREHISAHLKKLMPDYLPSARTAVAAINELESRP